MCESQGEFLWFEMVDDALPKFPFLGDQSTLHGQVHIDSCSFPWTGEACWPARKSGHVRVPFWVGTGKMFLLESRALQPPTIAKVFVTKPWASLPTTRLVAGTECGESRSGAAEENEWLGQGWVGLNFLRTR